MSGRQWRLEDSRINAAHTVRKYGVRKESHGAPGHSALDLGMRCAVVVHLLFHPMQSDNLPFISTTRAAYQAPFTVC